MTVFRLPVRVAFVVVAVWLLLTALEAYNDVVLTWFNFLLDNPLVNPLALDDVEALYREAFGPIVAPRLILFVLLVGICFGARAGRTAHAEAVGVKTFA